MKTLPKSHLVIAALVLGLARLGHAQTTPELIFADTFDTSQGSVDINFENDQGRQSGSAGVLTYRENTDIATVGLTQVNAFDAPGMLRLEALFGHNYTAVTPDHNFTEGGAFTIEFEVDAGINDAANASTDWACIVFGASAPDPVFVNASDGMGILFRNNGDIQVFDERVSVYAGNGDFPGGMPTDKLRVRIEVETADFSGTSPATVRMYVNDVQVRLDEATLEHVKPNGFRGNYITLGAYADEAAGNDWVHVFDNLRITAVPCIRPAPTQLLLGVGQSKTVTITIPSQLNQTADVDVSVTSQNPAIAEPVGGTGGSITLHFTAGGEISQSFEVIGRQRGTTEFDIFGPAGVCIQGRLQARVSPTFIANPSFEKNYNPAWPHYGPVDDWMQIPGGNVGVNEADGPFHDNGLIPDRARVALIQGNGGLSQDISGLVPGQSYWLQFFYNARNCCGGTIDLAVRFNGQVIDTIPDVRPVNDTNAYHFRNVVFTPDTDAGLLEFATTAQGDATVLLDAVTIVPRGTDQVVVVNPSFEASGTPPGDGALEPGTMAGWKGTGTNGVNVSGVGPYADNGINPDQESVAFIRGVGTLSQTLSNLVIGQEYQIVYSVNAASGTAPFMRVTMGGDVIMEDLVFEAGFNQPYRRITNTWVATSTTADLVFEQVDDFGPPTLLIDDVQVIGLALPPCEPLVTPPMLDFHANQPTGGDTFLVSMPIYLIATQDVDVLVISLNPEVAVPAGAVGDTLTLHYTAGGTNALPFAVQALGPGVATFLITNEISCGTATVTVQNRRSLLLNPSFEDNSHLGGVGYGPVAHWNGGSGVNDSTQPFADNGLIPDRAQIAFIQNAGSLSQMVYGLDTTKHYWLQVYVNARNCCGDPLDPPLATASFNGVDLVPPTPIVPVGGAVPYYFVNLPFTPNAESGELRFSSLPTEANGDRTLLLDAVCIVERAPDQVVLQNPSFEASGRVPAPGYISPGPMAGWSGSGNYGVNVSGVGPFADNGVNPDQDNVAFLQDLGSYISQTVSGLSPGGTYELSFAFNARSGNQPQLTVTVDGLTIVDVMVNPVGGNEPYYQTNVTFAVSSDTIELRFTQNAFGDQTVLLDDIQLRELGAPTPRLVISRDVGQVVRVAWPSAGGNDWVLQSSPSVDGPWTDVFLPVGLEGEEFVVYDDGSAPARFYRLIRP